MLAAGLQRQARAVEEVPGRARDEDLAGTGERGDPRRRVHAEAARLPAHAWSPSLSSIAVESTMSLKSTVARKRFPSSSGASPNVWRL